MARLTPDTDVAFFRPTPTPTEYGSVFDCVENCAARDASLPCFRDAADFAAFRAFTDNEAAWLGFVQSPESFKTLKGWSLDDGSPAQWINGWCANSTWAIEWQKGEPNNYGGKVEACACTGLGSSPKVFDAPCSMAAACICQPRPSNSASSLTSPDYEAFGNATAAQRAKEKEGAVVGQWIALGVRSALVPTALGLIATFACCLYRRGCTWRKHLETVGPAAGSSELLEPRGCCGGSWDVTTARALDPTGRASSRVRTEAFECIRGFAALQVSLGHCFTYWAPNVPHGEMGGGNAVLMFFLMSGFVMQLGYAGKGPADGSCPVSCCGSCCPAESCCSCRSKGFCCLGCGGKFSRGFWARRFARLAPMAWVAMLLYLPIAYHEQVQSTVGLLPEWAQLTYLVEDLSVSALFVATWLGCGINGPLWTLTSQWFFYLLFPSLTDCVHVLRAPCVVLTRLLYLWAAYVFFWMLTAGFSPYTMYIIAHVHPMNKVPLFLMGMLAATQALLHASKPPPASHATRWGHAATGITLFLLGYTLYQIFADAIFPGAGLGFSSRILGELALPLVYIAWFYALTQAPLGLAARTFRWKPFRYLGKISFCIYVLHFPLLHYYSWARRAIGGERYWGAPRRLEAWDVALAFLVILLLASICYHFVEEPCRKGLQRLLSPHGARSRTCAVDPELLPADSCAAQAAAAEAGGISLHEYERDLSASSVADARAGASDAAAASDKPPDV